MHTCASAWYNYREGHKRLQNTPPVAHLRQWLVRMPSREECPRWCGWHHRRLSACEEAPMMFTIPSAGGREPSCANPAYDPEWWFPEGDEITLARGICRGCEVRHECLEWALGEPSLMGIWGGLTERERGTKRKIMRLRERLARGHEGGESEASLVSELR